MLTSEIEQRRSYYRDVVRQWADNLYELDEHATYRLLAAGEMSGTTGEQTNQVMAESPQLWLWLGQLRDTLQLVDELVADQRMFRNNTEAVAQHLRQCDDLVEDFRRAYEPVRDVVARVDAVWRDLMPRIDAATTTLARASAVSERVGVPVPEVSLAMQRLEAVRASVADDPLSLSSKVGPDLDALVSAAAKASGALDRAHSSLGSDLEGTDAILAELRVLRARAAAAYSEAEAKVIPVTSLIRPPGTAVLDGPNGLAHRAAQIVGDAERGATDWRDARSALDRWHHRAQRLRVQLQKALAVNAEPIAQRNELRGRLRAYRVKASMTPGLADAVSALGQQAHDELYTSPTDLDRANRLINEFAATLSPAGQAD